VRGKTDAGGRTGWNPAAATKPDSKELIMTDGYDCH